MASLSATQPWRWGGLYSSLTLVTLRPGFGRRNFAASQTGPEADFALPGQRDHLVGGPMKHRAELKFLQPTRIARLGSRQRQKGLCHDPDENDSADHAQPLAPERHTDRKENDT